MCSTATVVTLGCLMLHFEELLVLQSRYAQGAMRRRMPFERKILKPRITIPLNHNFKLTA